MKVGDSAAEKGKIVMSFSGKKKMIMILIAAVISVFTAGAASAYTADAKRAYARLGEGGSSYISEYASSQKDLPGRILPESSTRYLSDADLVVLSIQELSYARNEIFAKYGRRFKSRELTEYFQTRPWYNAQRIRKPLMQGQRMCSMIMRKQIQNTCLKWKRV